MPVAYSQSHSTPREIESSIGMAPAEDDSRKIVCDMGACESIRKTEKED